MAYEKKPGQFSLFRNEKKENENQPDYKGDGMDNNGEECWISAWVKKPEGKKPFFSIVIQPKEKKPAAKVYSPELEPENDLPF